MNRLFVLTIVVALAMVSAAGVSPAMDAEELIEKNIEATGGLEKLESITSSLAMGKALAQGMEFPFVMKQARPNLMRLDVEVMGMQMVQAYDGAKGWTINPMAGATKAQPMGEIEGKSFKMQADMDGLLVGYQEKGYTVEYVGEADVEGTPVYQLRLDTHDDIVIDMFFEQEYFLAIKMSSTITWDEKVIESDTYMSDFQDVEGTVMPFSIETRMGEVTVNQIVIDTVEFNVEIDESIFVMPEDEAAAETGKTE